MPMSEPSPTAQSDSTPQSNPPDESDWTPQLNPPDESDWTAEMDPPAESDPTAETDPPAELEPSSLDTNPRVRISLEEYRERSAQTREQDDDAAPSATQDQQATATHGSHTPCYDEHGLELDYHNDVPTADSCESFSCSDYLHQLLDEEHTTPLANTTQPAASKETVLPEVTPTVGATAAANTEFGGWAPFLHEYIDDRMDVEDLLRGPTEPVTETEETVLLDETPTIELDEPPTDTPQELTLETPAAVEEPDDSAWSREIFAGLQNLTPEMLAIVSAQVDRLRQLAAPPAPSRPSPPGLPATPAVSNPMQEALLHAARDLGPLPSHQRTPTCPPGEEETERVAAQLVEQMSKAPGTPARGKNS